MSYHNTRLIQWFILQWTIVNNIFYFFIICWFVLAKTSLIFYRDKNFNNTFVLFIYIIFPMSKCFLTIRNLTTCLCIRMSVGFSARFTESYVNPHYENVQYETSHNFNGLSTFLDNIMLFNWSIYEVMLLETVKT